MKYAVAAVIVIFSVLSCAARVLAQDKQEPTYEETRKWIVGKIAEGGWESAITTVGRSEAGETRQRAIISESYDPISLDDCTLQFTEITRHAPDNKTERVLFSVPLRKVVNVNQLREYREEKHTVDETAKWITIDQYFEKVDFWDVSIDAPVIAKYLDQEGRVLQTFNRPKAVLAFGKSTATDKDTTARLKKALDHAVDLCKQKGEAF